MSPFTLAQCLECAEAAHLSLQLRAATENRNLAQVLEGSGLKCGNFTLFLLLRLPRWMCLLVWFSYPPCVLMHPSLEFQYQSSKSEDYNGVFLFSLSYQVWKYCIYV